MFWTLPNALSALRIVLAPVLLALAWTRHEHWFLAVLLISLVSDILDGKLARWLNQCSEWGARLDSWGRSEDTRLNSSHEIPSRMPSSA